MKYECKIHYDNDSISATHYDEIVAWCDSMGLVYWNRYMEEDEPEHWDVSSETIVTVRHIGFRTENIKLMFILKFGEGVGHRLRA